MIDGLIVTGSQVYGQPTAESDIDVVVAANADELELLNSICEGKGHAAGITWRFGNLNLIGVSDRREYMAWMLAKMKCLREKEAHGRLDKQQVLKAYLQIWEQMGLEYQSYNTAKNMELLSGKTTKTPANKCKETRPTAYAATTGKTNDT